MTLACQVCFACLSSFFFFYELRQITQATHAKLIRLHGRTSERVYHSKIDFFFLFFFKWCRANPTKLSACHQHLNRQHIISVGFAVSESGELLAKRQTFHCLSCLHPVVRRAATALCLARTNMVAHIKPRGIITLSSCLGSWWLKSNQLWRNLKTYSFLFFKQFCSCQPFFLGARFK